MFAIVTKFVGQVLRDSDKLPSFGRTVGFLFAISTWAVGSAIGAAIALEAFETSTSEHHSHGIEWLLTMAGIALSFYTGGKLTSAVEKKATTISEE